MNQNIKKALSIALNVVLTAFLIFAVIITIYATIVATSDDGVPSIGNTVYVRVLSDSMEGPDGFDEGSLIVVHKLDAAQKAALNVGDVITFYDTDIDGDGKTDLNTHRIVEVLGESGGIYSYRTKGDNKPAADASAVQDVDIVAKWTKGSGSELKGVGDFLAFMTKPTGFLCIIVLPLLAFFIFEIISAVKVIKKIRGKKTITAEDEEEIKRRAVEEFLARQAAEANSDEAQAVETDESTPIQSTETSDINE